MNKDTIREFFNQTASQRPRWKRRNSFYHRMLERYYSHIIPAQSRVLELGCGTGELLNAVQPSYGVGVDFSQVMIDQASALFPSLKFVCADAENLALNEKFDYIILSDLVGCVWDVHKVFEQLTKHSHEGTRIVISNYNYLWEPVLKMGEWINIKLKQPTQNWLSVADINNLLKLNGFETIRVERKLLFPKYVPIVNWLFNKILANLPFINQLDLLNIVIARPIPVEQPELSVSIVVPARNERGNIENAILRTPDFGLWQEFIFVEGHSGDNTWEEILRVKEAYPNKRIKTIRQTGKGKGNAVREAFAIAEGDVLMILDADLTTPPEEMPKFYEALHQNKGEFINGCRLVYPMEKQAMRFLNLLGNKFFGLFFTYLLGQRLKDTLCGTKVLRRTHYNEIARNRSYFGDFDPFGDFDLLFGAARLNLKMTEIIVRYRDREYGSTQISRFRHGILLFQMCAFAARKIKFI
jgi:SAM-dependent methyltransferase